MKKILWKTSLLSLLLILLMLTAFWQGSASACYAADENTASVYLTISENGSPVTGKDGTLLAHVPVTISAFDLAKYGLEEYRYGEEPTVLHLLIRATEQYYLGRPMTPEDTETDAFHVTNSPGSLYLKHFWGHDENLMYFVNHEYPLRSSGIGATADTIPLADGDVIDLAMFSSWSFRNHGQFAHFSIEELEVLTGEEVNLTLFTIPTAGVSSGEQGTPSPMTRESIRVSRDGGKTWVWKAAETDASGRAVLRFAAPGTYLALSGPSYAGYQDVAPAVSAITVTGEALADSAGCVDFSLERAAETPAKSPAKPPAAEPKPASSQQAYRIGKVTGVRLKAGTKAIRVRWKKVAHATGYQIQYSRSKSFRKHVKTLKLKKCPKNGKKISKLKAKKKYFVRVRAIRKAGGRTLYGKWSKVKAVKVKK